MDVRRASFALLAAAAVALPAAGEFRPLFNGRDLDGWTQRAGNPEHRGTFHVEGDAIVGTFVAGTSNTFLTTDRTFGDFVLEFEFAVADGVNSGVQFRSAASGARERVAGYQFEIDPGARAWTGGVYHEAGRGWLYPLELNPAAKPLLRIDAWNTARIECVGPSIRTWVNGAPVAHLIDDDLADGFIALQVHGLPAGAPTAGRTVRWRRIRIDESPAGPTPPDADLFVRNLIPNHLAPAEATQGWRRLFDGTDPSEAWRGTHGGAIPHGAWRVADGELIVDAGGTREGPRGDIVTRETFGAFELQLEFRPTRGANSGIKYAVVESAAGAPRSALGLEYQILDDANHPDAKAGVVGNRTLASLYDLIPSERRVNGRDVPRRAEGWNHARIVCRPDGTVEHWLNDFEVVAYARGDNIYRALVARSKYAGISGFGLAERGHLLLQDHGDEVRFRSIKVRSLDPADASRDYTDVIEGTAVSFDMVWIPEGNFWIGRHEVTWDEFLVYCAFDLAEPVPPGVDAVSKPSKPLDVVPYDHDWGKGRRPAVGVSWNAAKRYCEWLSINTGTTYRLPTEDEWALACGTGGSGPLVERAWFDANSGGMTQPVGEQRPNEHGLHDMLGNLWEYCLNPYAPDQTDRAVLRGGSWKDDAAMLTPDARLRFDNDWTLNDPNVPPGVWWIPDGNHLGFRILRRPD